MMMMNMVRYRDSYKYQTHQKDRHGRDRMVLRFTTTCAIDAYHH